MIEPRLSRLAMRTDYLVVDEERSLLKQAQLGNQSARDRLVLTHMRLARSSAMQFRFNGLSTDDLMAEGIIGLLAAVDAFDLVQEVRFATYARWWVRAKIMEYVLRQKGPMAFATSPKSKSMFFRLSAERFKLEQSGTLSQAEVEARLAEVFDVTAKHLQNVSAYLGQASVSLNEPLGQDGDERGTFLADEADGPDVSVQAQVDGERRQGAIQAAMARLNERERAVVAARYLQEDSRETFDALSRRFGVSKQRLQQIETKALSKLRALLDTDGMLRQGLIEA